MVDVGSVFVSVLIKLCEGLDVSYLYIQFRRRGVYKFINSFYWLND